MPKKETAIAVGTLTPAMQQLAAAAMSLPAPDDDPTDRMLAYIAGAPPEDWDALWEKLPNLQDNAGRSFRVSALRALPSDYKEGLPVYLICEVTWLDTGESSLLTCSSLMGIAQLMTLHRDAKLPSDLEIVRKEKATRRGFHPIHFRYLDPAQQARKVG